MVRLRMEWEMGCVRRLLTGCPEPDRLVVIVMVYRPDQSFEGLQGNLRAVEGVWTCDRSLLGWPRCFTDVRDSPLLDLKQA